MNVLMELANGFATALTWENLFYALIGCLIGTLIGVLPGIGPVAGVALLIPLTLNLEPTGAIIMLAAIFYGTAYGGTITSVLLNTPGEAASAITTIDGYEMTKQGRAGAALTIAALGSFIGGTVATILLVIAARPLGALGLQDRAARVLRAGPGRALAAGRPGRAVHGAGLISGVLGLLIAMVGIDPVAGRHGSPSVSRGCSTGSASSRSSSGCSACPKCCSPGATKIAAALTPGFRTLLPTRTDLRRSTPAIGRGTVIGSLLGLIPGMTGSVSSLLSYGAEKRFSRYRDELGHGAVEGVAGPETANNAHANGALIPLFTLGIPASPTIAVLMGAFLQQGLSPGPTLFTEDATVAWAIIASLFIGNVILLILNVPLVGLWTSILRIPYPILAALILMFLVVGSYTINYSVFDVYVMIGAGVLGLVHAPPRHPAGAAGADPRPRPADGALAARVAGAVPRRSHRVPHPPDQRGPAGHRRALIVARARCSSCANPAHSRRRPRDLSVPAANPSPHHNEGEHIMSQNTSSDRLATVVADRVDRPGRVRRAQAAAAAAATSGPAEADRADRRVRPRRRRRHRRTAGRAGAGRSSSAPTSRWSTGPAPAGQIGYTELDQRRARRLHHRSHRLALGGRLAAGSRTRRHLHPGELPAARHAGRRPRRHRRRARQPLQDAEPI